MSILSPFSRAWATAQASVVLMLLLATALFGCKNEITPSLFDPNAKGLPQPTITSISPANRALAGASMVTITGKDFLPDPSQMYVYFYTVNPNNVMRAVVQQATSTTLVMRAPNLPKDTVYVKVAVLGSTTFSNVVPYGLDPAYFNFDSLKTIESPWATAIDAAGNVYVSIESGGVKEFTAATGYTRSDYTPGSSFTKLSAMKISPVDGKPYGLYGSTTRKAISLLAGGNASPQVFVVSGQLAKTSDFDFDTKGNIWAAGDDSVVYRIKTDKSIKTYSFNARVLGVRYFQGYVYFAGTTFPDSLVKVVRFPIDAVTSDLGASEVFFNFSTSSAYASGSNIFSLVFASNGDVFAGTDLADAILIIHPDKSTEPLYSGLFAPTVHQLVWGLGTNLFAVTGTSSNGSVSSSSKILRINAQVSAATP